MGHNSLLRLRASFGAKFFFNVITTTTTSSTLITTMRGVRDWGKESPRDIEVLQKTRERYKRIRMNLRECVSFSYYFILIIILDTQVQCLRGNRREFEEIYIGISSSTKHTTSYNNSYLRLFNQKVYGVKRCNNCS